MTQVRPWIAGACILAGFAVADARQEPSAPRSSAAPPAYSGWPAYGGGPEQIRYSSLTQINRSNVGQLEVAWTYDSGETGGLQANPIVVDGLLFTTTPKHKVVALDASIGSVRWTFDSGIEGRGPNRGVTYWSSGDEARIFTGQGQYLYALDAKTGKPSAGFGREGRIDLREGLGRDHPRSRSFSPRPASSSRIC